MLARFFVLLAILGIVAGFMSPMNNNRHSTVQMLFNFGQKKASTPAAQPATSSKTAAKPAVSAKSAAPVKPAASSKPTSSNKFAALVKPAASSKPAAPAKPAAPVKPTAVKAAVKQTPAPAKSVSKPAVRQVASASSSSDFLNGLVGSDVEAPEFDPFQLSAGRSDETISWYRAAELKHGRIAMLAALGLSVQPAFHLPDSVFDTTLGYGAVTKLYQERPEAIWQILLALAAVETFSLFKNGQGSAGDLGFDPLNLREKLYSDPEKFAKVQLQELKHGRLAMWGSSALLLQEYVTGYGPYEQLLPH